MATESIKFQPNVPVTIKLSFDNPKEYDSQFNGVTKKTYMYGCIDSRKPNFETAFYATPSLHTLIQKMNKKRNDQLVVEKKTDGTKNFFTVDGKSLNDIVSDIATRPDPSSNGSPSGVSLGELDKKLDIIISHLQKMNSSNQAEIPF